MFQHLGILKTPLPWVVFLLVGAYIFTKTKLHRQNATKLPKPKTQSAGYSEDLYYDIKPLSIDLESTPPLKLRPFKPTYHMTMALESSTLSSLIAMDNTFASRCSIRKTLVGTQRHDVLACNPIAAPAVRELYSWLVTTYLPARYPTVYHFVDEGKALKNSVTGDIMPLHLSEGEEETMLRLLGENVDTEFLLMLPSHTPGSDETTPTTTYNLQAFINCFPSGFNTREKLGLLLDDIHAPVPGYQKKLSRSMNRFFSSLPIGKIVQRANWTVSTNTALFCLAGNHMAVDSPAALQDLNEDINLNETVLRCERQTLHRLPQTRALVFAFKTYQYPIRELRDEGSGEVLAEAIEGLGRGSVPEITIYKKEVVWGKKVKAFLRGEIDA